MGNSPCFSGLAAGVSATQHPTKSGFSANRQVTLSEMLEETEKMEKPKRGDSRSTIAPSEATQSEAAWSLNTWSPISDIGKTDVDASDVLTTGLLRADTKPLDPNSSRRAAEEIQQPKTKSTISTIANRFRFASAPAAMEVTSNESDLYEDMFESNRGKSVGINSSRKQFEAKTIIAPLGNGVKDSPQRRWSFGGDILANIVSMRQHSPEEDDLLMDAIRPSRNSHYA